VQLLFLGVLPQDTLEYFRSPFKIMPLQRSHPALIQPNRFHIRRPTLGSVRRRLRWRCDDGRACWRT
jgi:hypothetical protein